jgi:hypothetical protein
MILSFSRYASIRPPAAAATMVMTTMTRNRPRPVKERRLMDSTMHSQGVDVKNGSIVARLAPRSKREIANWRLLWGRKSANTPRTDAFTMVPELLPPSILTRGLCGTSSRMKPAATKPKAIQYQTLRKNWADSTTICNTVSHMNGHFRSFKQS